MHDTSRTTPRRGTAAALRFGGLAIVALLAACSGHREQAADQSGEAQEYIARARGDYTPPGPPSDPWGPYIRESSKRFDVPDTWIRQVMRVESGGNQFRGGRLITSPVGAMGLMQVMPQTYDELRSRYDLGDDAFDPHNNILAGAAYMREMYDIYGSPGFLAAYNAGPKRLDDYLANTRPLPAETRHYVAMAGPGVVGISPKVRSPAEDYAMNELPIDIPPGLRYGGGGYDVAETHVRHAAPSRWAYVGRRGNSRSGHGYVQLASASSSVSDRHGYHFHLIGQAMAEPIPVHRGAAGGKWFVPVTAVSHGAHAVPAMASGGKQQASSSSGGCSKTHKGHGCGHG